MQNLKSFSDYDPRENINEGLTDFFRKAIEYIVNWFKRETKDQSLVKMKDWLRFDVH